MLKNILKLNGAKVLNKIEQQSIGGSSPSIPCLSFEQCLGTCINFGIYCFSGPMQPDGSICYSCVSIEETSIK